ncbi:hypothetical protein V493_08547 [Pseudogymnoascus sp. VKM F-4281 (FW-2241)]|nr:hypothetical protein V493_08547 [Pseudogymnoascus sp. VKM F-4281 (FW-2241)]
MRSRRCGPKDEAEGKLGAVGDQRHLVHQHCLGSFENPFYRNDDKLRAQQQLEQLQARYVGTGHADTTKFEWTSNIQRDSYASYIGHPPLLSYMTIGMGEPKERVRAALIEKMIQPVGKPPEVQD